MSDRKQRITRAFSDSVDYYAEHGRLQKQVAERLGRSLEPWQHSVPDGPVIEVGAGTGFFSTYLTRLYSHRSVILTDISRQMIDRCRSEFNGNENIDYKVLDAETAEWPDSTYALIAGNFVAQWFKDPSATLSEMMGSLKPGGLMLMSFPGNESFPQWKKYCLELGLPYTGIDLPDVEQLVVNLSMGPVKVDFYEDQSSDTFKDVYEFFRHLKKTGTSVSTAKRKLTPRQLRLLNNYWLEQNNGKVTVHYHTAFIAAKRDLNS
ncbi:MAG: methyltransferase domain-containing protein [Balneolaceae bacterium]